MQNANKGVFHAPDVQSFKIAIVQSRFNAHITDALTQAAQKELITLGVTPQNITIVTVPGALEIPLALQALARNEIDYSALIALGCVIRGQTYHFELVANESAAGITRIGLDHHIPIANAVLTTENETQALARTDEKGRDAAHVAIEMAHILTTLSSKASV